MRQKCDLVLVENVIDLQQHRTGIIQAGGIGRFGRASVVDGDHRVAGCPGEASGDWVIDGH